MKHRSAFALAAATGLLAAILVGRGQAPPPQGPPPAQPRNGTALITGQVVDAGSGQPVPDALVALGGRGGPADRVLVDARGRFVFQSLPGGIFTLAAAKPGWFGGAVDQHQPTSPGRPIELGEGQRLTDLTLRVWKFGAIDGAVMGEGGEALAGIEVHALRRALAGGRWMMSPAAVTSTDDRGHYRIDGLPPGDYSVAVRPSLDPETPLLLTMLTANPAAAADVMAGAMATGRRGPDQDARVRNYAMTFYPAATSVDRATLIAVAAGQERAKIDVRLKLSRVARVSGAIAGVAGSAEGITMELVPAEASGEGGPLGAAVAACDANGQFEFSGVTPGRYLVRALSAPRPAPPGQPAQPGGPNPPPAVPFDPAWWGGTAVTVAAADVSNVSVTLHRAAIVSGRVIFNGGARPAPVQIAQIALRLDPVDQPVPSGAAIWRGQIDQDGLFTTMGVPPGRYLLRAGAAPRWTPQSAVSGGRDILDVPLTLAEKSVDDVVLTFSDRPMSAVTGMVRRAGGEGAPEASVLVFPADRDAWMDSGPQARRLKLARPTEAGRYGVGGLPAGEYLVAAVADQVPAEWQEPQRLDALARVATRVRIEPGETHALDLEVTKAAPQNQPAGRAAARGVPAPATLKGGLTSGATPGKPSAPASGGARPRPAAAAPESERARTAALSGTVVDDARHQPSPNAIVMVVGTDVALMRVTSADAQGRFSFAQLPAGKFLLGAGKSAHLAALYAARRPGRPGTVIALDAGQRMNDITLTLMRGAVITGRILDVAGQPVPGARVRVMQHAAAAGEVAMSGDVGDPAGATTNDRGVYRIFDLPPGEYAVAVQARVVVNGDVRRLTEADVDAAVASASSQPGDPRGRIGGTPPPAGPAAGGVAVGYLGVYYPGTAVPVEAEAITLAPGEERSNVDLRTRLVRFARVEGTVTNAGGPPPANVQMTLRPRGMDASGQLLSTLTTRPGPDGRFTFNGVPPGDYTLHARTQPPPAAAPGRPLAAAQPQPPAPGAGPRWAMRDVSLTGENVSNIALDLQPALAISGRLTVEGLARLPDNLPNIRVGVRPTPGSAVPNAPDLALVDRSGRFTLTGLVPGKYRLYVQVPNNDVTQVPEWFATSAMLDGRDALDMPIDVGPGAVRGDALITLTDDTQEVSGTVRDRSGRPSRDCAVVVFPVDRRFWFPQSRRIVFRQSNTGGEYVFGTAAGLPAGDYFLAAMPDGRAGEQFDPRYLDELAATAVRITLQEGDAKTVDVRIGGGITPFS
jgi:protocatechuate 3,4-dioxygenase beta subunit